MIPIYRWCIRPILFRFDPERIHNCTIRICQSLGRLAIARKAISRFYMFSDPRLRIKIGGIDFPNPIGLAAGFDKNGRAVQALASAGFGAIEIGSVSEHFSAGNPERPRLFRLPADEATVVYYGVPNDGAKAVAQRLASTHVSVPLGINLVETNRGSPATVDRIIAELVQAAGRFVSLADYFALNLNCPNTSGGTSAFDDPTNLHSLLVGFLQYQKPPPVFLKLRPTNEPARIDAILKTVDPFSFVKGVIFSLPPGKPYPGLKTPAARLSRMPGTLCGRPTRQLVNDAIRSWYARIDPTRLVLVGVGGIGSAEDAYEKIRLGASLVQVYTTLIYHGPSVMKQINQGLCRLLERDGLSHISEAVGIDTMSCR